MTEHYYTKKQTSKFEPKKIKAVLLGRTIELYTAGGVFSPSKVDRGTMVLIDAAQVKKGWKILDLACGYGVVGIAVLKKYPDVKMYFTDVNERAVKLTRMNLRLNKLVGKVVSGDGFEKIKTTDLDTILFNPPQTAGKKVCFGMIEKSYEHLVVGGSLQLVARHNKGGKDLEKKMIEVFGNSEQTAKKGGFRVYVSKREE